MLTAATSPTDGMNFSTQVDLSDTFCRTIAPPSPSFVEPYSMIESKSESPTVWKSIRDPRKFAAVGVYGMS
jgi:hypothetical protein